MNILKLKTDKIFWKRRSIKFLLVLLGVFLAVVIALYGVRVYRDIHPQSYINFTQYRPIKIIYGAQLQNRSLEVWAPDRLLWFVPNNVIVDLVFGGVSVREWKVKDASIAFEDWCGGNIAGTKCIDAKTLQGQAYRIVRTYSEETYSKLLREQAIFDKDGTRVQIGVQPQDNAPVSEKDWSDMIDSFEPTVFTGFTIRHMSPGP